jgi:hypothetical protein
LLGGKLCIYNLSDKKKEDKTLLSSSQNTQIKTPLQELSKGVEEGGNTTDGHAGTVGDSSTGAGGRGRAASAGGSAGLAVGGGRVVGLGVTVEGTLDNGLADVLEVGAVEGALSALQVEATLDIGQTIKVNTRK